VIAPGYTLDEMRDSLARRYGYRLIDVVEKV
jgi:hypothetical protein